MAYFSNGTQGEMYFEKWCSKCHHMPENPEDGGCAVHLAHLIHNYDECNNDASILDILIPRTKDGLGNEQCKMFVPRMGKLPGEPR